MLYSCSGRSSSKLTMDVITYRKIMHRRRKRGEAGGRPPIICEGGGGGGQGSILFGPPIIHPHVPSISM